MLQRTDLTNPLSTNGLYKNFMMQQYMEHKKDLYATTSFAYKEVANILNFKEANLSSKIGVAGAFIQETSIIGGEIIPIVKEGELIPSASISEGFVVYGAKKRVAQEIPISYEYKRDAIENYLDIHIRDVWTPFLELTKEKMVMDLFNYGGFTAGHTVFDNSVPMLCTPSYGNFLYDGKPFFNLSGNLRTAKNGSTYYNSLPTSGPTVSMTNLKAANNLKTAVNNRAENGMPFNNAMNKLILCPRSQSVDWGDVTKAQKDPDVSASNRGNALGGEYKIVVSDYLTNSSAFFVGSGGKQSCIDFYISEPTFKFWEDNNPEVYHASVSMDLILYVRNFRPWVAYGAATS